MAPADADDPPSRGRGHLHVQPSVSQVAASPLSPDDRSLIDAVRAGDEAAFSTLFDTRYSALARFARHYVATPADVDEIIADVFLSLWMNRKTWQPDGGIAAYLFRAVRNRARNTVRDARTEQRYLDRAARESAPGMSEPSVTASTAVEITERESSLWTAIDRLPERSRTLLELRWRAGLSSAVILSS